MCVTGLFLYQVSTTPWVGDNVLCITGRRCQGRLSPQWDTGSGWDGFSLVLMVIVSCQSQLGLIPIAVHTTLA